MVYVRALFCRDYTNRTSDALEALKKTDVTPHHEELFRWLDGSVVV